jgi:hypothetical protein
VETLRSSKGMTVRRLWLAIPSRGNHLETLESDGARMDRLTSNGSSLDVEVKHTDWPLQISAYATGDDVVGRSDRGAIPLQLILESKNISMSPGASERWEITLSAH